MTWLTSRLHAVGANLLALFSGAISLPIQLQIGDGIGSLAYFLLRERREVSLENLRLVFGDQFTLKERRSLARRSMQHLVRVFLQAAWNRRMLGTPRLCSRRIRLTGDWDALHADRKKGRGGLIVAAHLGNWEVGARALRTAGGLPLRVVARTLDNPALNTMAIQARGGAPVLIRKRGGMRDILRALRAGDWVAMAVDQNAGYHGEFVPFLGVPASTFPTPAVLAERLGVPIYIGTCIAEPGLRMGFELRVIRLEAIGPTVKDTLVRIHDLLEPVIRAVPEQYVWCHRRWKTRPPDTKLGPDQPGYGRVLRPLELSRAHRSARSAAVAAADA